MTQATSSIIVQGIAKLVWQLDAMLQDLNAPAGFDAGVWLGHWLTEPLPALGGARPIDHMDTPKGQALVSTTLARIQSGAYG